MTRKHFCLVAGLLCIQFSSGQGLINNGAQIVITNTSNIHISGATGNLTNQAGGTITNNSSGGKIILGGNWVNNAVISIDNSTVEFNGTTAQSIEGSNATPFYNINASGGGVKTFSTSFSTLSNVLTLGTGTNVNGGGKLTLLSTATKNANVAPIPSDAVVSGDVIVQSFLTGGRRVSKGLSSPIDDQAVVGDKTYKQLQSKLIITGPGGVNNGFDLGGQGAPEAVTLKTYNEVVASSVNQFSNIPTIATPAVSGKGFFLFFRGNRIDNYNNLGASATGSKLFIPYATPEDVTIEYKGPINQQNVTVPLSYTDHGDNDPFTGFNLVGNPYPSIIDWHAVLNASSSSISNHIYVYKQDGSFEIYTTINGTIVSTANASRYLMPGQAFYVQANAPLQNLIFTEASKTPEPAGSVMRFLSAPPSSSNFKIAAALSATSVSPSAVKLLRMSVNNSEITEETILAFTNSANENYDSDDAPYLAGSSLIFFSKSDDGKYLSIDARPEPKNSTEVKLYIAAPRPGKFSLSFGDLSQFGATQVYLHDSYLNITQRVESSSVYDFEIVKDAVPMSSGERFKLFFRPVVTFPDLIAKKVYGGAELTWQGLENLKSETFSIERSNDGVNFTSIGSVKKLSDLKSGYLFHDVKPGAGENYYRLKLVEDAEVFSYSNVASLSYADNLNEPGFKIFPNPVFDVMNVVFKETQVKARLEVYNLNGQKLRSFTLTDSSKGEYLLSDLTPGIYVLKARDIEDRELGSEKLIKH